MLWALAWYSRCEDCAAEDLPMSEFLPSLLIGYLWISPVRRFLTIQKFHHTVDNHKLSQSFYRFHWWLSLLLGWLRTPPFVVSHSLIKWSPFHLSPIVVMRQRRCSWNKHCAAIWNSNSVRRYGQHASCPMVLAKLRIQLTRLDLYKWGVYDLPWTDRISEQPRLMQTISMCCIKIWFCQAQHSQPIYEWLFLPVWVFLHLNTTYSLITCIGVKSQLSIAEF